MLLRWILSALVMLPASLCAQVSAEIGARLPATWAHGDGAPDISTRPAPLIGFNIARTYRPAVSFMLSTRLSNSEIRLKEEGATWSGGTLTMVDVLGGLAFRPEKLARWSFEGGAGITILAGARTVAPFHAASRVLPSAEATATLALPWNVGSKPLSLFARGTFLRIGGANSDDAVNQPGTVKRISLGVRLTR